jgi:hypothetical protein
MGGGGPDPWLRGRCVIARSAVFALVLGFVDLNAPEALALAADHPKDILTAQGPNCVHGYFVNSPDMFFFAGDTAAFNQFVDGYGKRKDLTRRGRT